MAEIRGFCCRKKSSVDDIAHKSRKVLGNGLRRFFN